MERQKIYIQRNRYETFLGHIQNATKYFPHIQRIGKEKYGGLCHRKTPNMAPQNNDTNTFKNTYRTQKTGELEPEEGLLEIPILG